VAACAIYDSSLLLPTPGQGDGSLLDGASQDGASALDAGPDSADPCNHMLPPERPDGGDGADDVAMTFAFNGVDVGLGVPLDLDRTCTCPGPSSCTQPSGSASACDGTRGQDDSFTQVFAEVGFPKASFASSNSENMLLIVKNYNGTANDPAVTVSFVLSSGLEGIRFPDAGPKQAAHDGTDEWTVDPDTLFGGIGQTLLDTKTKCDPATCIGDKRDSNAYVRDGVLVASFDGLPSPANMDPGRLVFDLNSVVITARIVPGDGGAAALVDGGLSGRWAITPLLHNLFRLAGCVDNANYQAFHGIICKHIDVASSPAQDNTGVACDAVSTALGFSAVAARGGHAYRNVPEAGCAFVSDTCP
jgi:hypothetical protein